MEQWTIGKVLDWSKNYLTSKECKSARLDSELIIANSLGCDRVYLYTHFDKPLSDVEKKSIREKLLRRAEHEPVAHIIGYREFYGRPFSVDSSTLIPRPDSELIVDLAKEWIQLDPEKPFRVIDIGAGSGCLGLSLALECPSVLVDLLEINSQAVDVLSENKTQLKVENVGEIFCEDIFEFAPSQKYDVILSNPPYIDETEKKLVSREVLEFEPEQALFAEKNGLLFYEFFARQLPSMLNHGGNIFLEFGFSQSEHVYALFNDSGFWSDIAMHKDLSGHTRALSAKFI